LKRKKQTWLTKKKRTPVKKGVSSELSIKDAERSETEKRLWRAKRGDHLSAGSSLGRNPFQQKRGAWGERRGRDFPRRQKRHA